AEAGEVGVTGVDGGGEGLAGLDAGVVDGLVLGLDLPDMPGAGLLRAIAARTEVGNPPLSVVLYSARDLTRQEDEQLRTLPEALVVKRVTSPERLLDATTLLLHRVEVALPEPQRLLLQQARRTDPALLGKKVLIVDDDMRNIFALTSALERHGMEVTFAETGQEGIDLLTSRPDIDVVLMDIML